MQTGLLSDQSPEAIKDREHLRMLSICHYIMAGLSALCGFFPIIYLALGIAMLVESSSARRGPPAAVGWVFIGSSSVCMLGMWIISVLLLIAGRNLARFSRRTFCFVVACIACVQVPFGTILGIFTIIVLSRPSVKALFEECDRPLESPTPDGH